MSMHKSCINFPMVFLKWAQTYFDLFTKCARKRSIKLQVNSQKWVQSFDSHVCIGKSRGYCRSRAIHHLSGWWPCGCAVWGGRYKWFWRKHTVGGGGVLHDPGLLCSIGHDDELNHLLHPPDTSMGSQIRDQSIRESMSRGLRELWKPFISRI